ncbi:hypothetical protein CGRA01v4_11986 [Colletotrichum graminicola]|uniref:Uncharacterized protein n=1 Tax=Colletotrichum graminicola (strain M1.001 / M2 / FGSC 10212) TaxID=645133 RepID=E3QBJ8_COLGM|nr:uncharacterized protein GLRG_03481 [Colletotrichum graminicola M1.001]EFQ28337.1 hypothetical protein GLRG_03481 [Colletotrichum graminicola M1.001]WDK20698.1 hypothetical protein CGRA01v4_11986 [Colletotrichum graminicola]
MPGNDGKANPANREEVRNPGGNDQDSPITFDAAKHGASASGSEHTNVSDHTAEPASETGGNQSGPSTTDEATAQEKDASMNDRDTTTLPQQARPDEDADAGPRSTLAVDMEDPRAWFPSAVRPALPELPDDTVSSSRLTGAELGGSQRAGCSNPKLHEGGPRPEKPTASSPEDTAFILGEEYKGSKNVSDLIYDAVSESIFEAKPRPLSSVPHAPGAAIAESQPDITAARRGMSAFSRGSVDNKATGSVDDRGLLPSLMAKRSASPLSASGHYNPRETGRHEGRESSRWNISDGESEEGAFSSMLGADVPAPLRIPGRSQATDKTQKTQGNRGLPSENPSSGQGEAQPTVIMHAPIPTGPVQFSVCGSPVHAPEPLASNPPLYQSQTSSRGTITPTQDRFRAYKLEPPRHGRGFDHRRARAPDPGMPARTHLFVTPQPLSSAEHRRIIEAYNVAFDATSDATKTLLSKRHRYPGYTRDVAAERRRLEFEAVTGESMNDEAYYALFDLETSNDGMLSALLEWMQGRTWIKVPFVNRIIHQVCRLMFTSAQEEARLRLRFQRDCDLFRDEADGADEKITLERMRNSWERMDTGVRAQHLFAKANASGFRDPDNVERNCDRDAERWNPLSHRFTYLLHVRDGIENAIRSRGGVLDEDLDQLERIYRDIKDIHKETSRYMTIRKEKSKDPELFRSNNRRVMDFAKFLDEDVNTEERVREATTARFLEAAAHRMRLRGRHDFAMAEDLPEPSIPATLSPETVSSPRMGTVPPGSAQAGGLGDSGPASSQSFYKSPTSSAAGPSSPSQVPAYPPADPYPTQGSRAGADSRPNFKNPWEEVRLRPRESCTRCPMLERELEAKQNQIDECRREKQLQSDEVNRLEGIVRAINDKDMQAAFKHMDGYQDMVRAELREALQFIVSMLDVEGQRAHDQTSILEASLRSWQAGGSKENVVTEIEPMARSVKRLATSIRDAVSQITNQLEKVDSEKEVRLQLLEKNDSQRRSLERLRKEKEDMEATATEAAKTIQQQMQEESDRLKEQIRQCQSQLKDLRKKHEERDTDDPPTADSSIQDLKDQLKRKEVELSELEAENKALEEQLATTMAKIEALSEAKEQRDEQVKNLEEHLRDLQIKLDARAETAKWSWWPRRHTSDSNFENQQGDRIYQLRIELIKELGKTDLKPYKKINTERRELLPSLARSVLWPRKLSAAKLEPYEDSTVFWRLAAFSRRRGETVAALERRDLAEASERLDSLQAWNTEMGSWKTEAQSVEVLRSINFLRSYANLEIRKTEGFGASSSQRLEAARKLFNQTTSSDGTGGQMSWDSLKECLGYRLDSPEEKPVCECEYKQRICAKHKQRGGARYHNFVEEEEDDDAQEADIELTQEAYNSLQRHALAL